VRRDTKEAEKIVENKKLMNLTREIEFQRYINQEKKKERSLLQKRPLPPQYLFEGEIIYKLSEVEIGGRIVEKHTALFEPITFTPPISYNWVDKDREVERAPHNPEWKLTREFGYLQKETWNELLYFNFKTDDFKSLDYSVLFYYFSLKENILSWFVMDRFGKKIDKDCSIDEFSSKFAKPPRHTLVKLHFDEQNTSDLVAFICDKVWCHYGFN